MADNIEATKFANARRVVAIVVTKLVDKVPTLVFVTGATLAAGETVEGCLPLAVSLFHLLDAAL